MQIVFATPICAYVRLFATKASDVLRDARPHVRREFNGDERSEGIRIINHRRHRGSRRMKARQGFGSRIKVSFVARSIAALLNGNARGVTLRQSSN